MSNTMAIKEVANLRVERFNATGHGDILFPIDYATETTISATGQRLDIRAGQGFYKIVSMDYQKDCTFKCTLALVDIKVIAEKLGSAVTTAAATVPKKELLAASASNTITLTETPLAGTLKIYKKSDERDLGTLQTTGTPATTVDTYSITDKVVTLNPTTAPEGAGFYVFYDYTSGTATDTIKITANNFPGFIRIIGDGFATDDQTGEYIPITFDIRKAKVKQDFEITMKSDAATEVIFECDCYTIMDSNGDRLFANIFKLNDEAYS
jgi:hypothetical protein